MEDSEWVKKNSYKRMTHHEFPPSTAIKRTGFFYVPLTHHNKIKPPAEPKKPRRR